MLADTAHDFYARRYSIEPQVMQAISPPFTPARRDRLAQAIRQLLNRLAGNLAALLISLLFGFDSLIAPLTEIKQAIRQLLTGEIKSRKRIKPPQAAFIERAASSAWTIRIWVSFSR